MYLRRVIPFFGPYSPCALRPSQLLPKKGGICTDDDSSIDEQSHLVSKLLSNVVVCFLALLFCSPLDCFSSFFGQEIFLKYGNASYKLETVQRIRQLVGEIIHQWEEKVREASERGGGRSSEEEAQAHRLCTLKLWTKVRSTLDNSKRTDFDSVFD